MLIAILIAFIGSILYRPLQQEEICSNSKSGPFTIKIERTKIDQNIVEQYVVYGNKSEPIYIKVDNAIIHKELNQDQKPYLEVWLKKGYKETRIYVPKDTIIQVEE